MRIVYILIRSPGDFPAEFEKHSSSKCFSNWRVQKNYLESLWEIKMQLGPSGMELGSALLTSLQLVLTQEVLGHTLSSFASRVLVGPDDPVAGPC